MSSNQPGLGQWAKTTSELGLKERQELAGKRGGEGDLGRVPAVSGDSRQSSPVGHRPLQPWALGAQWVIKCSPGLPWEQEPQLPHGLGRGQC